MTRDTVLKWLSRAMFFVAATAAASLVFEYGFYLTEEQRRFVHLIDLSILGIFIADALLRFAVSRRKLEHLKARWPALIIVVLVLAQFGVVGFLAGRGWLPAVLRAGSVFSIAKAYIIVIQVYLVMLIIAEGVRANRRIASMRVRPARTVMLSFLFIILAGTLLLLTPKATPRGGISAVDALFTATSSVCVTGLIVRDTGSGYTGFGQGVILTLIQIGGLGLITFTAFFATVVRRGLGVREATVLRGMLSFETIGQLGRTLRYMIGITFLMETTGAVLLYFMTRHDFVTAGGAASRALFHSISAFCNAGFSLFSDSFERYATNVPVNLTMTSLIIVGGLGFPVIMNVLSGRGGPNPRPAGARRWTLHTRLVFAVTLSLLVIGTGLFLATEWDGLLHGRPLGEKVLLSYFGSVTARTAGFNTVNTGSLTLPTLFLLSMLMFIGGSPGGTAGGVKTSTFGIVVASIKSMFGGSHKVEMFKRRIPETAVREALVIVAMGLGVVVVGTFVLLVSEKLPLSHVLFEVVSAFGTVGLSTGITPGLSNVGKVALMAVMLTGRIGPLTLALAIGQRGSRADYDYPEERVVIG